MYKVVRLFTIIIALMLSGCSPYKPADYSSEVCNLQPKQIVEYYVNAWSEKQYGKMDAVLSNEMKSKTFNYDSVNAVKLVSVELVSTNEQPATLGELQELNVYKVELNMKLQYSGFEKDETSMSFYYVGKKNGDNGWHIYDVVESN